MELITFDYLFFIYLGIFFLGGLVKGTIGVGLPPGTQTLLSFFFDIKDSISFILIPVILTNLVQMLDGKELKSIFHQTKFFLITSVVFVIPGFLILRAINSNTILLILASLLVLNSCATNLDLSFCFSSSPLFMSIHFTPTGPLPVFSQHSLVGLLTYIECEKSTGTPNLGWERYRTGLYRAVFFSRNKKQ